MSSFFLLRKRFYCICAAIIFLLVQQPAPLCVETSRGYGKQPPPKTLIFPLFSFQKPKKTGETITPVWARRNPKPAFFEGSCVTWLDFPRKSAEQKKPTNALAYLITSHLRVTTTFSPHLPLHSQKALTRLTPLANPTITFNPKWVIRERLRKAKTARQTTQLISPSPKTNLPTFGLFAQPPSNKLFQPKKGQARLFSPFPLLAKIFQAKPLIKKKQSNLAPQHTNHLFHQASNPINAPFSLIPKALAPFFINPNHLDLPAKPRLIWKHSTSQTAYSTKKPFAPLPTYLAYSSPLPALLSSLATKTFSPSNQEDDLDNANFAKLDHLAYNPTFSLCSWPSFFENPEDKKTALCNLKRCLTPDSRFLTKASPKDLIPLKVLSFPFQKTELFYPKKEPTGKTLPDNFLFTVKQSLANRPLNLSQTLVTTQPNLLPPPLYCQAPCFFRAKIVSKTPLLSSQTWIKTAPKFFCPPRSLPILVSLPVFSPLPSRENKISPSPRIPFSTLRNTITPKPPTQPYLRICSSFFPCFQGSWALSPKTQIKPQKSLRLLTLFFTPPSLSSDRSTSQIALSPPFVFEPNQDRSHFFLSPPFIHLKKAHPPFSHLSLTKQRPLLTANTPPYLGAKSHLAANPYAPFLPKLQDQKIHLLPPCFAHLLLPLFLPLPVKEPPQPLDDRISTEYEIKIAIKTPTDRLYAPAIENPPVICHFIAITNQLHYPLGEKHIVCAICFDSLPPLPKRPGIEKTAPPSISPAALPKTAYARLGFANAKRVEIRKKQTLFSLPDFFPSKATFSPHLALALSPYAHQEKLSRLFLPVHLIYQTFSYLRQPPFAVEKFFNPLTCDARTPTKQWPFAQSFHHEIGHIALVPTDLTTSFASFDSYALINALLTDYANHTFALTMPRLITPSLDLATRREAAYQTNRKTRRTEGYLADLPLPTELQTFSLTNAFTANIRYLKRRGSEGYFFALDLMPNTQIGFPCPEQNFIFVIDGSGTITKNRFKAFKKGVTQALHYLQPKDSFSIFVVDAKTSMMSPKPLDWNKKSVALAKQFLASQTYRGFFAPNHPFSFMDVAKNHFNPSKHNVIVLLTDGHCLGTIKSHRKQLTALRNYPRTDFSLFTAASSTKNRLAMLDLMSTLTGGELMYCPTNSSFPRKLAILVKHIEQTIAPQIRLHTAHNPSCFVHFYPTSKAASALYSSRKYTLYGKIDQLTDFDLLLQGKSRYYWINIKQHISFRDAKKGSCSLAREIDQQRAYMCYDAYLDEQDPLFLTEAEKLLMPHAIPPATR